MRCAFILKGAIGSRNRKQGITTSTMTGGFVDYEFCAQQIFKHIINCNKDVQFDIFIQSWTVNLKQQLINVYKPVSTSFINDTTIAQELKNKQDQSPRSGIPDISMSKSWVYAVDMVDKYATINDITYDMVFAYRIDIFLWKDIDLQAYDVKDHIYVNNVGLPNVANGDFYFIMNYKNFLQFRYMYDLICEDFAPNRHVTHQTFIKRYLNVKLVVDEIGSPRDLNVMRKMQRAFNF